MTTRLPRDYRDDEAKATKTYNIDRTLSRKQVWNKIVAQIVELADLQSSNMRDKQR